MSKKNSKEVNYKDVKMSNKEIREVLDLLYVESQYKDGKFFTKKNVNDWAVTVDGLPKHLLDVLEEGE